MDEKRFLDTIGEYYNVNGKIRKIPLDILIKTYEEIEATMVDLKDFARLLRVCEILYEQYKNDIPLTLRIHVATYLLNLKNMRNTEGDDVYVKYYNDTMEATLYEINLANYLKGE